MTHDPLRRHAQLDEPLDTWLLEIVEAVGSLGFGLKAVGPDFIEIVGKLSTVRIESVFMGATLLREILAGGPPSPLADPADSWPVDHAEGE